MPESEPFTASDVRTTDPNVVDYVVVVHGMGRQRRGESLVAAVQRFAEASRPMDSGLVETVVSLGQVSQSRPWFEFEGIPAAADPGSVPFDGRADDSGRNLRFVEVYWSDITESEVPRIAEPVDRWLEKVARSVGRHDEELRRARSARRDERKQKAREGECEGRGPGAVTIAGEAARPPVNDGPATDDDEPGLRAPFWLLHLLRLIRTLLLIVRPVLSVVRRDIVRDVFDAYAGDVQAYCESEDVRGRAIGRFHRVLHDTAEAHEDAERARGSNRAPRFTIVAHSLGSVLSLDALVAAHLSRSERRRIPGYRRGLEADPLSARVDGSRSGDESSDIPGWCERVTALVTFGSPIEKVIALWPRNYLGHLRVGPTHAAGTRKSDRIRHLNFIEETDVFADPLPLLRTSELYRTIFDPSPNGSIDEWFTSNEPLPFVSHVRYWADTGLFAQVREVVWGASRIDRGHRIEAASPLRTRTVAFEQLPCAIGFTVGVASALALAARSISGVAVATTLLVTILIVGVTAVRASVWWWCLWARRESLQAGAAHLREPSPILWLSLVLVSATMAGLIVLNSTWSVFLQLCMPALVVFGALAVVSLWSWARRLGGGPRWRLAHLIPSFLASGAVAMTVLRLRDAGTRIPHARGDDARLVAALIAAGIIGAALAWSAKAASLPQGLSRLRRSTSESTLWSWGVAGLVWLLVPTFLVVCGHYDVLPAGSMRPFAPFGRHVIGLLDAHVEGVDGLDLLRLAFLLITGCAAMLTVAQQERQFAARHLGLEAWMGEGDRFADYVDPGHHASSSGPAPGAASAGAGDRDARDP